MMRTLSVVPVLFGLLLQAGGQESRENPDSRACLNLREELAPLFDSEEPHLEIAGELVSRIEDTRSHLDDERSPCHAELMEWEGHLRIHTGELERSVEALTEFLDTHRDIAPLEQTARVLRQRGFVLDRQGRLAESAANYTEAAALADDLPPGAATAALRDAGMTYHVLGDFVTAEKYYREAENVIQQNAPSDSSLLQLQPSILDSRVYLLIKQADESLYPEERHELAIQAASLAANACHRYRETKARISLQALCVMNQAQAERLQENWAASEQFLDQAAPLVRDGAGINPRLTHWLDLERGDLARDKGNLEQARRLYTRALESAMHHADPEDRADIHERIGQLEEESGHLDEASNYYTHSIDLREVQRERFRLQEWSISAFANMQQPYRGLARVRLRQGHTSEAFAILDRARARHFRDLQHYHELRTLDSDTLRSSVDSLVQLIEEERLHILDPELPPDKRAETTSRLAKLTAELESLQPSPQDTLSVPDLQLRLGEKEQTLLAYLISESGSTVFLARADTFLARPLPEAFPRRIDSLLKAVGAPWNTNAINDPALSLSALANLYDTLIRPIQSFLNEGERLLIIPDSRIAALPFAALVANHAMIYKEADYLIKHHPVSLDLSAEMVLREEPSRMESVNLLALGQTTFQDSEHLPDLTFVEREIRRIARQVPNARTWIDDEATEAHFIDLPAETNILHVASHAIPDPSLPSQSRIHLWDDPDSDDDGVLHLHEFQSALSRRDNPFDLVVLSGCSTARGKTHAGEGILGLQYAVRSGGARSSVATLWSVDDRASVDVMARFYEHLMDGKAKDQALQLAQLDYLNTHEGINASPFYWAAASISGNTGSLMHGQTDRPFVLWILMGLAVAGLLALILHKGYRSRRRTRAPACV